MAKKVWKIADTGDKEQRSEMQFKVVQRPRSSWKNPALAFTLSLLVWGSGQLYNGQWKRGALLSLLMALYGYGVAFVLLHWSQVSTLCAAYGVPPLFVVTTGTGLYLCGLALWMLQALQAYKTALRTRRETFRGVHIPVLPMFASLVIPGWGQMLNGQRKKGIGFLVVSLVGFAAAPVLIMTPAFWSMLQTASDRLIVERAFTISLIVSPFYFLAWLFAGFDALKVSLDEVKKEPLKKRWEYTINRIRMYGLLRGAVPQIRLTIVLSLVLLLFLGLQHVYAPDRFYDTMLQRWERSLSRKEMVILPDWIHRSRQLLFPEGS
jgi:TM2 domain-containing membrane protein YozV